MRTKIIFCFLKNLVAQYDMDIINCQVKRPRIENQKSSVLQDDFWFFT